MNCDNTAKKDRPTKHSKGDRVSVSGQVGCQHWRRPLILLLNWNVALPSYGRHSCLSWGLPTYPEAQLTMVKKKKQTDRDWFQSTTLIHLAKVLIEIPIMESCRDSRWNWSKQTFFFYVTVLAHMKRDILPFTVLASVTRLTGSTLVASISKALTCGGEPVTWVTRRVDLQLSKKHSVHCLLT